MAEYVPTDEEMRDAYAALTFHASELIDEYDRWLIARYATVKAEALREAADVLSQHADQIEADS